MTEPTITPQEDARAALRMIRECIETYGPPGVLPAREWTGGSMVEEAEAICEAIRKITNHNG